MPIHHRTRSQLITRRRLVCVTGSATAALLLAGCGGGKDTVSDRSKDDTSDQARLDFEPMFAPFEPADEPNGDPAMVVWPEFVLGSPPEIQELYAFHVTSGELMRYMPCFCGCTGSGHRNNRDCYIREVHADGSITFDSMAPT